MSGRYERELVNILTDLEYGAVRIPTSGAATDRDLPDVLYAQPTRNGDADAYAVEHKSGRDTTLYVEGSEVAALERFCAAFGAKPRLGARYTSQATPTSHYLVDPDDARMTDGGNYGLPTDDIDERAAVVFHG